MGPSYSSSSERVRATPPQLAIGAQKKKRRWSLSVSARRCYQGVNLDMQDPLAPNTVVTLDAAHASRRLVSRTFKVDEYMKTLLESYVIGKKCIVELIENSYAFSDMFANSVENLDASETVGGDIKNLGMAKHMFNSLAKRLWRLVGKIFAVMEVAETIRVQRAGREEAKHAEKFLREFQEEDLVQLAMLADAADEAYILTAYCDDEESDTSLQAEEVAVYIENVEYLFKKGAAITAENGYTSWALKAIKMNRILNVSKDSLLLLLLLIPHG